MMVQIWTKKAPVGNLHRCSFLCVSDLHDLSMLRFYG